MNARTLGPFYRIVIRDRDEDGPIMAVSSGFTVPAMGLMHCDSLEIFTRGCDHLPLRSVPANDTLYLHAADFAQADYTEMRGNQYSYLQATVQRVVLNMCPDFGAGCAGVKGSG